MPWRVFPWDPAAKPGEPFSPSHIFPQQGSGRFDVAGKLVVYLADTAVHAVAEKLQRFRGQKIDRQDLIESGKTLAIVVVEGTIEYGEPEPLAISHTAVQDASAALGSQCSVLTRE